MQLVEAGRRIKNAGITLYVTVLLGIGGIEKSVEHALDTAKILTAKFYATSLMSAVYGKIAAIRKNDRSLLQMTDELFTQS